MFRKSIFIMLFVCLLASSNYVMAIDWNTTVVWHNTDGDQNWFNPNDWVHNGGQPDGVIPPDADTWTVIEPYPGPRINGDAVCQGLGVAHWSWSSAPNMAVELESGTLNAGEVIILSGGDNFSDFDPNAFGSAGLIVRSGTVTTPVRVAGQNGLYIGGGGSTYSKMNTGNVTMYGGLISVPRIALYHGVINLFGGTLECDGEANFIVYQNWPDNKISISGGTLRLAGNHAAELTALYANGRIFSRGGAVGAPVYDAGTNYTTITGTGNSNTAWNPIPEMNATNVHYRANDVNTGVLLTWNRGDTNVIQHDVYFGTSAGSLSLAQTFTDANNGDPCSLLIPDSTNFKLNTSYYWRVDETAIVSYNYDEFGTPISNNTVLTTGQVWTFKTHDGKAYNPKPQNAAAALSEPLQLSWTAGDFTASTLGHKVYFTSAASGGNLSNTALPRPTDSQYRGQQTGTIYPLANLAGAFTIVPGRTYYWAVDEVLAGGTILKGPVWNFTAATYVNVDDFQDYNSTLEVNAVWLGAPQSGPYDNSCGVGYGSNSGLTLISAAGGAKYMQFTYINSDSSRGVVFSETRRPYVGGTNFTGGGALSPAPAAFRVDYLGAMTNGVDPDYDRMYLALEDTAGNVAIYLNPDASAARSTTWASWFSSLKDVCDAGIPADVKLAAVNGFCLGFGDRATCRTSMPPDLFAGDGNVMFDNIRLYSQTCNPSFAHTHGVNADLDNDCDVDVNDLDNFASNWLWAAVPEHTITGITAPHKTPVIWYKFNEGTGATVVDYGPGAYTVDVCSTGDVVWSPTGGRNGDACINFNTLPSQNTRVEIPLAAFDFMNDDAHYYNAGNGGSLSISVWINGDLAVGDTMTNNWTALFCVFDVNNAINGTSWFSIPASYANPRATFQQGASSAYGPLMSVSFFGGKWNHWAAVKSEPNTLVVYCNGSEVVRSTSLANEAPFFKFPITSARIGMRGGTWNNWGKWTGKVQDFKIYDYALDANEVAYEATDGTGVVVLTPLVSTANVNLGGGSAGDGNQVVNLKDLATMCQQWHQLVLWP